MSKRAQFRLSYSVVEQGGVRGRPKEVATLKKVYHDSAQVSKVLIVEGKAGVGKSALIVSQQSIFYSGGHFVSGTFDQQRQSEPFSAIVDALHELFEELLSEEFSLYQNSAVKEIIEKFQEESKNDAGMKNVLKRALPKFADLLQVAKDEKRIQQQALDSSGHSGGLNSSKKFKRKAAAPVGVKTKLNRSVSGFKKGWNFEKLKISLLLLLRCICSPKRRVVIFLDDVHYADPSSLELIEFLASGDGLSAVPNKDAANPEDDDFDRVQGLLLILAYRNVATPGKKDAITIEHPFRTRLKELKQLKCPIHRIHVKELDLASVNSMVATVTRHQAEPQLTMPLSEVIYKKTGGNPFAVLQMLEFLEHAELLYFSLQDYRWHWKNARTIHSATDLSDTMADLAEKKILKLPLATQQILMVASCLGSYFRLEVVAAYFRKYNEQYHKVDFAAAAEEAAGDIIEEKKDNHLNTNDLFGKNAMSDNSDKSNGSGIRKSSSTLMNNMIKLLKLPLIQDLLTKRRKSTTYFFAHERLQNAAYSLLPDDGKTRKEIHWRLGKLMKEKSQMFPEEHWMAYLATDQLNRGLVFLHDTSERVELAQMNLQIAIMSQEKSAFCPAAEFLRSAIRLLFAETVEDPLPKTNTKANPSPAPTNLYTCGSAHHKMVWNGYYELCLDMFSMLAEMEYLLGNHRASKQAVDEVLQNARSEEDKFRAQVILIESISAQRDFDAAIDNCLKILAAYDMKLSASPMKLQIMAEKKKVNKMLEQQFQQDQDDKARAKALGESFNQSASTFRSMNGSFSSMAFSTRSNPAQPTIAKPTMAGRARSVGTTPKNEHRFPSIPKNEGRFRKAVAQETSKIAKMFHKKQEQAMMTLPKMTDDRNIRISKLLSQLMLNSILSGKTDLSAYVGLRSIRFSFQYGISPHSPMALAAYGISQAKEGKYNEAYANGMLALKLLEVADSKEWYTRTILKCHNLRHIKKPFHESLDPLMDGYRTGVESGDMEYALVAAMQYSLLYLFVGLPLTPLEPDLTAFAEQVHRYHLPYVLEITFYIYREFVLDLQGIEHDKISLDENSDETMRSIQSADASLTSGSSGVATPESPIDKRVRPLVEREMCMMNLQKFYLFGEYEEAEKMMNLLNDLPKYDYSVLRTLNRDSFFGLVNLALAKITGKKKYRDKGRKIIDEFETYVKKGSINGLHLLHLLQAEDTAVASSTSDWINVTKAYDEAIRSAGRSGFTSHEALANERAGRFLSHLMKTDKKAGTSRDMADRAKQYISRAMALYKEWGAKAKVDQLESHFPQLQPSNLMKGTNIKARRRFSRGLTARFRDMKLHSGRWSVGASSDLKILDGFDELHEQRGSTMDPYGLLGDDSY